MRMMMVAIFLAFMVASIGAATSIIVPPVPETLVEGHTVFTELRIMNQAASTSTEFAAAVAFLVRETISDTRATRFPGVLWFNDQYLTDPLHSTVTDPPVFRYPCGAAIAANASNMIPINATTGQSVVPHDATYVESYKITTPNNAVYVTDKWIYSGYYLWSVALGNGFGSEARYGTPDDGTSNCGRVVDLNCNGVLLPFVDDTPQEDPFWREDPVYHDNTSAGFLTSEGRGRCQGYAGSRDPFSPGGGSIGDQQPRPYNYPCGGVDRGACKTIEYNAVLFFFLQDLEIGAAKKNHTDHSTDYDRDVAGCHQNSTEWGCPMGDDSREGNSHAFNPMSPGSPASAYPAGGLAEGRNNHGGSADCDGQIPDEQYCHATGDVQLNFGYVEALPPSRIWRVYDVEGDTAPYHCHEDINPCNEEDLGVGL